MEVYYKPKDIVWVKLGKFWWPGEVVEKDSAPQDLLETLKKEPIATVKFFDDEEFYEFVKSPDGINPYNCERKYDFIKKGMDAFRAKNSKMKSFPKDVSTAEVKTGGNANILSDPIFTTERKRMNYAAEIFGSPTAKKPRESLKARAVKSEPIITHRRFLGYDDYQARVLIPTPDDDARAASTPTEAPNRFTCPVCQFSTDRLGILTKHTSCHVKEISFQSRQPIKKPQKRKRRKALSDDDDVTSDDKKTKTKRKYTKKKADESLLADDERSDADLSFVRDPSASKYVKKSPVVEQKKDICDDIIADWDDEDHEEEKDTTVSEEQTESEHNESSALIDTSVDQESPGKDEEIANEKEEPAKEKEETPDKNKSCFDFDEDDEEARIPDATSGRKIPRVIPITDRRKTFENEDDEEELKKKKILEESEQLAKLTEEATDADAETLQKTYQSLMDETENLDIPDVPNILKNEQNFHSAKTVKYPDKTDERIEPEVAETEEKEVVKEEATAEEDVTSKPEIRESDIDAFMAKHALETGKTEDAATEAPSSDVGENLDKSVEKIGKNEIEIEEVAMGETPVVEEAGEPKTEEQPEPKRRKTTRSSRSGEEPSRRSSRGRSVEAEGSSKSQKDQKHSRSSRRSTRWEKNSTKVAEETADAVKQPEVDKEETNSVPDEKTQKEIEPATIEEEKEHPEKKEVESAKIEEENEHPEKKEVESATIEEEKEHPEKKEVESATVEKEKKHQEKKEDSLPNVEQSPRDKKEENQNRLKRGSERDKKIDDRRRRESKPEHSPHRSSRSGTRSTRHDKDKSVEDADKKNDHPKDSGSSRRSRGPKDGDTSAHDDSARKSGRKDDRHSQKPKSPDRKSSRDSGRHDKSSKSPRETKGSKSPPKREPELRSRRSDRSKEDAIDPIKELFAPSGQHVAKTREQKREELKNIFSFDYDERDFRKRKTYGHRRKSKPVDEEKFAEVSATAVPEDSGVKMEETVPTAEEKLPETCELPEEVTQENVEHVEVSKEVVENVEVPVANNSQPSETIEDEKQIENETVADTPKDKAVPEVPPADAEINTTVENSQGQPENKIEIVPINVPEEKQEVAVEIAKPRTKKPRKPSRWDKIETVNQEEENKKQETETQPTKIEETTEITKAETSQTTLDVDESSQKEMDDIFSKKQQDKNTEQIELIFGTSPLPGSNENTVFPGQNKESAGAEDEKQQPGEPEDEKKNDDDAATAPKNSSFEHVSEAMDFLESQVAKITHYEEPEQDAPKGKEEVEEVVESQLNTQEVSKEAPAPVIEERTNENKPDEEKKTPPTTEKVEIPEEPSNSQEAPTRQSEVATKLTNPKKRFVKSFEDSEINKQREMENSEAKPPTSLITGKSPIAFKLKKQFLSKRSIFDEPDEEKPKTLPKLRSLKNESALFAKRKIPAGLSKTEGELEAKTEKIPEASAAVEKDDSGSKTVPVPDVKEPCENLTKEAPTDKNLSNLVHFSSESNSVDFCIDSTRSILGNLEEFKELKPALVEHSSGVKPGPSDDHIDPSKTEIITKNFPIDENKKEETEYVTIDGNLTVVSEKELAEGQVEITASMPKKKPMTLMSFSMDFSDESSDASFNVFAKEKVENTVELNSAKEKGTTEKESELKETDRNLQIENEKEQYDDKYNQKPEETARNLLTEKEKETVDDICNQKPKVDVKEQVFNITEVPMNNIEIETTGEENLTVEVNKEDLVSGLINQSDNSKASSCPVPNKIEKTDAKNENNINVCDEKKNDVQPAPVVQVVAKTPPKSRPRDTPRRAEKKAQIVAEVVNEPMVIYNTAKSSTVTEMCDLEDHIPSQIVCTQLNEEVMKVAGINNEMKREATSEPEVSKLLGRLAVDKKEDSVLKKKTTEIDKNLVKAQLKGKTVVSIASAPVKPTNKAIILSEKIIRPAREVPVAAHKRNFEDIEDIEPYVIPKTPKLELKKDETIVSSSSKSSQKQIVLNAGKQVQIVKKQTGKAKILNQTIIRPAAESVVAKASVGTEDNVDFDINSMPIVLSDELLTPESLENMPIVLGEQQTPKAVPVTEGMKIVIEKKTPGGVPKLLTKTVAMSSSSAASPGAVRAPVTKRTTPKILQTTRPAQKVIRQVTPTSATKSSKFVVVSEGQSRPPQLTKKPNMLRKTAVPATTATSSAPSESTGHKIMIFTNQQGKQQRLLLTPAQQKMLSMQLPGKAVVKSATAGQKSQMAKLQTGGTVPTSMSRLGVQLPKLVKAAASTSQVPTPHMKIVAPKKQQKVQLQGQQHNKPHQKTIVISGQHGQSVRKIQGNTEALLERQVAEQLEAIKVSSMRAQQKQQEARTAIVKPPRKAVIKKPESKQSAPSHVRSQSSTSTSQISTRTNELKIPPLAPVQKIEDAHRQPQEKPGKPQKQQDRPLNQLVIQDAVGNQTTITEGQILALPSETLDGQPQSYMLVTLDESGNLTPLNNEALMSLDPSLAGLSGGDLSNMVIQMDAKDQSSAQTPEKPKQEPAPLKAAPAAEQVATAQVQVTCNVNGEQGQQIILSGDPVATQKFLDSLSDGSTDLANILAGAEGGSFLIQADGQQILINTETAVGVAGRPDQGSPMFPAQPGKNQDILAAALADTDVFQQDQVTSKLSPGQNLYPMNVGNVLETSLTLNSPIMTPLEVPSTNSKRIPDDEAGILTTHVPKNVDLPITITDPNISQTVSHQQVLMASDLQSNLELSLPISETGMSVSSGINSPSFVYSLPNLEVSEHTEISQKTFSGNMPLLTEDMEEKNPFASLPNTSTIENTNTSLVTSKNNKSGDTFIEEGLCTLGAEMCSSLSEPPPEMFDIPIESDNLNFLNNRPKEKSDVSSEESSLNTDDNSLEISVQSEIVSDFKDASQSSDSSSSVSQDKKL